MIYKTWKNGVKRFIPICDGCGENYLRNMISMMPLMQKR